MMEVRAKVTSYAQVPRVAEDDDIEIPPVQAVAVVDSMGAMNDDNGNDDCAAGVDSLVAAQASSGVAAHQQDRPHDDNDITWEDPFFNRRTDVVAVYDYDSNGLFAMQEQNRLFCFLGFYTVFAFLVIMLSVDDQDSFKKAIFWLCFIPVFWCCFYWNSQDKKRARRVEYGKCIPHTAIVQTGLLHVQPPLTDVASSGYTVLIPFSAMGEIKVQSTSSEMTQIAIQVQSADTGSEYVIRGGVPRYGWTASNAFTSPFATFTLEGLCEPCRFKQLLMTMKDEGQERSAEENALKGKNIDVSSLGEQKSSMLVGETEVELDVLQS